MNINNAESDRLRTDSRGGDNLKIPVIHFGHSFRFKKIGFREYQPSVFLVRWYPDQKPVISVKPVAGPPPIFISGNRL